jgi:four helix bundle protein
MSDELKASRTMIERFEDFVAWQKARALTNEIYLVTAQGSFAKDWGLSNQIQRASVSIMSNIAEGFERGRPAEFHQFLSTSKSSCAEVRSDLYVAFDVGHVKEARFEALMAQAEEVGRLVGGLRASVERRRS